MRFITEKKKRKMCRILGICFSLYEYTHNENRGHCLCFSVMNYLFVLFFFSLLQQYSVSSENSSCLDKGTLLTEKKVVFYLSSGKIKCDGDEDGDDGGLFNVCSYRFLWPEYVVCKRKERTRAMGASFELDELWLCIADGNQWTNSVHMKCPTGKQACIILPQTECHVIFDPFHSMIAQVATGLVIVLMGTCMALMGFVLYATHCCNIFDSPNVSMAERYRLVKSDAHIV